MLSLSASSTHRPGWTSVESWPRPPRAAGVRRAGRLTGLVSSSWHPPFDEYCTSPALDRQGQDMSQAHGSAKRRDQNGIARAITARLPHRSKPDECAKHDRPLMRTVVGHYERRAPTFGRNIGLGRLREGKENRKQCGIAYWHFSPFRFALRGLRLSRAQSPSRSPNSTQVLPSKRARRTARIGEKLAGAVFPLMPGKSSGSSRFLSLATCFITFSRVRSSPHCLSTCNRV